MEAASAGASVKLAHLKSKIKAALVGRLPPEPDAAAYSPLPDVENAEQKRRVVLPEWIINPDSAWYIAFWYLTIAAAAWTGAVKAFSIAFEPHPGLHPFTNTFAVQEYALTAIFTVDMVLQFRLAYRNQGQQLVGDASQIRARYLRGVFWVDLVALLPLDGLVLAIAGTTDADSSTALTLFQFCRMLRILRMHRVPTFFLHLEYKLTVSLLAVTLVRNVVFTFFSAHWSACIFYFIARQHGLGPDTWIGSHVALLHHTTSFQRYIYALYWSTTTLATVGFGDFSAQNSDEAAYSVCYMFWNLGLSAYILGSFTLIVLRGDERVGSFRDKCSNLREYSSQNKIPPELKESMQAHLRLHFETQEASDEAVLGAFPATIRRRILRHLYAGHLRRTYLLQGCRQKFLDALLAVARVETYMPRVGRK